MVSELRNKAEEKSSKICDKGLKAFGYSIDLGKDVCDFMLKKGETVLKDICD